VKKREGEEGGRGRGEGRKEMGSLSK